jgi:hypothetical protein
MQQRSSRTELGVPGPDAFNAQWFVSMMAAAISPTAMNMATACWYMAPPLRRDD